MPRLRVEYPTGRSAGREQRRSEGVGPTHALVRHDTVLRFFCYGALDLMPLPEEDALTS